MAKSSIEWTTETWNPVTGCSRISDGCTNCYAEKMTKRLEAMGQVKYAGLLNAQGRFNGTVKTWDDALQIPLKTKKPTTYFVNSMSDLFHANLPDEFIDKVFAVMALCPQHTFQILTKRPERMRNYFAPANRTVDRGFNLAAWLDHNYGEAAIDAVLESRKKSVCPSNVWLGVSVEDQKAADERIPLLLQTPAAIRWLSVEPLLGPVDLTQHLKCESCIDRSVHWCGDPVVDWVVVGGESGPGARDCDIHWIRSVVEECKAAEVPVFVKQLGAKPFMGVKGFGPVIKNKKGGDIAEFPPDLQIREFPTEARWPNSYYWLW